MGNGATARRKEERKLQDQWQYLMQEKNNVGEQKRNIEATEAKISEVRDLILSTQQLKSVHNSLKFRLLFIV